MTAANRRPTSPPPVTPGDDRARSHDEHGEADDLGRLVSQAIDIVRYAPIAILLDGPGMLPQLAEKGKQHVENARWLGKMFLDRSGHDLRRRAQEVGVQAYDLLKMFGVIPADDTDADGPEGETSHRAPVTRIHPRETVTSTPAPSSDHLAIPDYDSLSASQVVNRLPSLSADELAAVYAYESAQRGRKTILNKVAQLQVQ